MLIRLSLFILLAFFSTPNYAFEDDDARRAILQLRVKVQENETKYESKIKILNEKLDAIEIEVKKLKSENEKMKSDSINRNIVKENPEYQELKDEINSIKRLLLQLMSK
jgi:hypothetical protein